MVVGEIFFQAVSEDAEGKPVKSIPENVVDHWLFYKDPELTGPPQSFVFIVQEGAFLDHPYQNQSRLRKKVKGG